MLARFARPRRGQATVELALILPLCLWLMLGVIDFGRAVHLYVGATNAAREGARYWASNPTATTAAVQAKVQAEAAPALSFPSSGITLSSPTPEQRQVRVQIQFAAITPLISTAWGGGPLTLTTQAVMPVLS